MVHVLEIFIIDRFHEELLGKIVGMDRMLNRTGCGWVGTELFERDVGFDQIFLVTRHFLLDSLIVLLKLQLHKERD